MEEAKEQEVLHGKCRKNYPNVVVPQRGRGFFGIGIEYPITAKNVGTLWRSAHGVPPTSWERTSCSS